jgi:8-amino-7-oxononanoate synthase
MLLVDEAHATGVFGERGSGLCEAAGLTGFPLTKVGTLSKALGSHGAFVAGPRTVVTLVSQKARSYVFSTAAPAALAAAGLLALQLVEEEPQRRVRVLEVARRVRETLREQGWNCGAGSTQIVPVFVGEPDAAVALSARFADRGLWVPAIRPPSVPPGESLLRISLSAAHSDEQIAKLLDTFRELRPERRA